MILVLSNCGGKGEIYLALRSKNVSKAQTNNFPLYSPFYMFSILMTHVDDVFYHFVIKIHGRNTPILGRIFSSLFV